MAAIRPSETLKRAGSAGGSGEALLLGRERELGELEAALAEARAGRGQLVMIGGEPGIGKTRLAEALSDRARAGGALVVWGRGWEGAGAPALWHWVQVIRAVSRERAASELERELGPGAGWLAHLVPELRERFPGLPQPGSLESEQARFALFDAVTTMLANVGSALPVVVVLDDLHTAHEPSLLLLDFLVRGIRESAVLVIATYHESGARHRREIQSLLGDLARTSRRVLLRGLGEEDIARVIQRRGGGEPSPELVGRVHRATDGNPFFSDEVVRLLAAEGRLESSLAGGADLPLPDSVRETIVRRLDPLPHATRGVLTTASVVGRRFRLATLERATGVPSDALLEILDAAAAADLVAQEPGAVGGFRFAHGLIGDALYGGLSPKERAREHRAVGEALERVRGSASPRELPELAHHFLEAAPAGEPEKAVDYAARAGRHAMEVLSYEQAADFFDRALGALELQPESEEARRAELLLALGQARLRAGQPAAREVMLAAAEAARGLGAPELLARVALSLGGFGLSPGVVDQPLVRLLTEALEAVGEDGGSLRARLLVRLAVALYWSGDGRRCEQLVEEALRIAHGGGDRATLAYVLSHGIIATRTPANTQRCLEWSDELFALSDEVGDVELGLEARSVQIDFLLELDDVPAADMAIETFAARAEEAGDPRGRSYAPLHRARRAVMEGRFEAAEELIAQASAIAERLEDTTVPLLTAADLFAIRWYQGRLGELEDVIRRFADGLPAMPSWRAALGLLYLETGRSAEARRELHRLTADGCARLPRNNIWVVALALAAELCSALGEAERARALYDLLLECDGRNVVAPVSTVTGPVSRYLGVLAAAMGDTEAAERHLAAAREAVDRVGARPTKALLCLDEARMLAARGGEGDRARALALLEEAEAIAGGLGMRPFEERARELRERLGGGGPRPAEARAAVSAALRREGDVWALTFEGRVLRVRDAKGLHHLALLMASPGVEFHALDIVGGRAADRSRTGAGAEPDLNVAAGGSDAGELLDVAAKRAYRSRLEELREDLEEAESFNDPERAARAREEIEFLGRELAGAVGLGGRDRRAASDSERARVNVTRAIRTVLRRIAQEDEALGRELETTVRTGTFCSYQPDPRRAVTWEVEAG